MSKTIEDFLRSKVRYCIIDEMDQLVTEKIISLFILGLVWAGRPDGRRGKADTGKKLLSQKDLGAKGSRASVIAVPKEGEDDFGKELCYLFMLRYRAKQLELFDRFIGFTGTQSNLTEKGLQTASGSVSDNQSYKFHKLNITPLNNQ